jgi:farnesyl-diphosphate farnesyltransferase
MLRRMFLISSKAGTAQFEAEASWKRALRAGRIADPAAFAEFMLAKVSRTFALNIRVLPFRLRNQVLLAYLFCRMADTLEDDGDLLSHEKVRLLEAFRGLFPPGPSWERKVEEFAAAVPPHWADSDGETTATGRSGSASPRWDRLLVHHCRHVLPLLREFPEPAVTAISACVDEMCAGMIRFIGRQEAVKTGGILIGSLKDLDDYCYYVAGTVGNLLCDLFTLHSPLITAKRARALRGLSVSFGLGLQLTNILKDIHDDRGRNVSYLPTDLLATHGLTQDTFLSPDRREQAARVLEDLIRKANGHLEDAVAYSCHLPRLEPRIRLFCLWPLFMAEETLVLLAGNRHTLSDATRIKISRDEVGAIVRRTSLACWSNRLIRALFQGSRVRLEKALASGSPPSASLGAGFSARRGPPT